MNGKLSLTELQQIIKDSLYMALPDLYWVIAEISEIRENYNGHCYLELIEKHPDDINIRARIRAVIWSSRYRFLKSFFENATGETLRDGLKILVRVKIEYHEIYGLTLVINDIDPAFTLGEMALKRQQIIRRLNEEGVISMSKDLDFPVVPQRIAIISSRNAAGYTDFMKHLTGNTFGYIYYTALFEAPMQGNETESGIIGAFNRIASHLENFDLAVIIRGGGSQTDLSWFDNYNIAFYITQFPIPVITGIGHEKDLSVADIVAYRSLKTPTAVADFIIECTNNTENHLAELSGEIIDLTKSILEENKQRIETSLIKLVPLSKMIISDFREVISGIMVEMINTGKSYIMKAGLWPLNQKSQLLVGSRSCIISRASTLNLKKQILESLSKGYLNNKTMRVSEYSNSIKILNPENVLRRGYTITSLNGKIIKKRALLNKDDKIETRFSDGSIVSKVL